MPARCRSHPASVVVALAAVACVTTPKTGLRLGQAAFDQADYQAAFAHWRTGAEGGEAEAQNKLGTLYEAGLGVARDETKAVRWYTRAAKQGLAEARANLERLGQRVPMAYRSAAEAFASGAAGISSQASAQAATVGNPYAALDTRAAGAAELARYERCQAAHATCVSAVPSVAGTPEHQVAVLSCKAQLAVCR